MIKNIKKGFTLVETLLYVSILVIVVVIVIQIIFGVLRIHRRIAVSQALESSGAIAMDRMIREIRLATVIDDGASSLSVNPGVLSLTGIEDNEPYTVAFNVLNGVVRITKDGGTPGNLTSSKVQVTDLLFQKVDTTNSEGVRITLSLQARNGTEQKTITLYGFAVVRGSY